MKWLFLLTYLTICIYTIPSSIVFHLVFILLITVYFVTERANSKAILATGP